jgi:hypothetical protein
MNRGARPELGCVRHFHRTVGLKFSLNSSIHLSADRQYVAEAVGLLTAARNDQTIVHYYRGKLGPLIGHQDLAVSVAAARLAHLWGSEIHLPTARFPAFYSLVFDDEGRALEYDEPEAAAGGEGGITIDNPLDWTWAFKRPVELICDASGMTPMQIRLRCHHFIGQLGGIAAFGAPAQKMIRRTLNRLDMRLTFLPPAVCGAILGLRRVAGELVQAGRFDQTAIDTILYELGFHAVRRDSIVASPRPVQLRRPTFNDNDFRQEASDWVNSIDDDCAPISFGEDVLLAEITSVERMHHRRRSVATRIRLAGLPFRDMPSLDDALTSLPLIVDLGTPVPLHTQPSRSFVARFRGTNIPDIPSTTLVICPYWAERLRWRTHSENASVYVDSEGSVVGRSIWWRDGAPQDIRSESLNGDGHLFLLTPKGAAELRASAGEVSLSTQCWRKVIGDEEEFRSYRRC